jgi:S1-C subfamily serine protease
MIEPVYSADDSTALLYATCQIVALLRDGTQSIGTGFFFSYPAGASKALQVLVTNKHVVADAIAYELYFHDAMGQPGQSLYPSGISTDFEST